MNRFDTPLDSVALSFVDRIDHGDVEGLESLMSEDHEMLGLLIEPDLLILPAIERVLGYVSLNLRLHCL